MNCPASSFNKDSEGANCAARLLWLLNRNRRDFTPDEKQKYFLLRAWAVERGALDQNSSENQIREVVEPRQSEPYLNLVSHLKGRKVSDRMWKMGPEVLLQNFVGFFTILQALHVESKIPAQRYLVVNILGNCSNKRIGYWLAKLKARLLSLDAKLSQILSRKKAPFLWPNRMSSGNMETGDAYEGCFVFGFRNIPDLKEQDIILDIAKRWQAAFPDMDIMASEGFYITFAYGSTAGTFKNQYLNTCRIVFPRPFLTAPSTTEIEDEPEANGRIKHVQKGALSSRLGTKSPASTFTSDTPKLLPEYAVLNCLKHDAKYNIDEYVVEYHDRHAEKLKKKPASEWILETTDDGFIPRHRIRYITRCSQAGRKVVWDRENKIDLITGSGRTTISDLNWRSNQQKSDAW